MEVKQQLLRLVRLQAVAAEVRSARELIERAPGRLEEIEQHFRERNAEYVAVKQRHDALHEDQRSRSLEVQTLEQHKNKYMEDLMQVQNQREYSAMLKEIDTVKSQIDDHEEAILKDMEEIESSAGQLAQHEEHIKAERQRVESESAEVAAAVDGARSKIEKLLAERASIESELPASLVSAVARVEESRHGQFLAKAEDGVCQSCFVRVRPQGFQEIKLGLKIHYCSNCRRLLYHAPSLERFAAGDDPNTAGASGNPGSKMNMVEAVDGGAV